MARKKKGKSARRSRQGLLGLTSTSSINKTKPKKEYEKRTEIRKCSKDQKMHVSTLKEASITDKDTIIRSRDDEKLPHTFVIHMGRVGRSVRYLERDLRQLLCPFTSKSLKVVKRNNFKDFLLNGQFLGISHIIALTLSKLSLNIRIVCCPQGPTLHFKVIRYSICKDILATQKRPLINETLFKREPLVVLSGFNDPSKKQLALVQATIQHLFPSIDIDTVDLATIKRVLLVSYDQDTDLVEFRHYSIKSVPCGMSKSTKKLMQSKIPDLSKYEDISDFLINPGVQSDSEFEGEQTELDLPQDIARRGSLKGQRSKIRLLEIGPRMTLKLMKIEEAVNSGEVLYHSLVQKTWEEVEALRRAAPMIRKKKQRTEKAVEYAAIRKLKIVAQKSRKLDDSKEQLKRSLIKKQREIAGDVLSDDEESAAQKGDNNPARRRFK